MTTIVRDIYGLERGIRRLSIVQLSREQAKAHAPTLRGIVSHELSRVAGSLPSFAARLQLTEVPPAERMNIAASVIGCAFAASLHDHGWSCTLMSGEPSPHERRAAHRRMERAVPRRPESSSCR